LQLHSACVICWCCCIIRLSDAVSGAPSPLSSALCPLCAPPWSQCKCWFICLSVLGIFCKLWLLVSIWMPHLHPHPPPKSRQICGSHLIDAAVCAHISFLLESGSIHPLLSQVNAILAGVLFWLPYLWTEWPAGQLASDLHCSPVEINWIEWPQLGLKYALQWTHLDPSGWLINRPTRSSNKHRGICPREVLGLNQGRIKCS